MLILPIVLLCILSYLFLNAHIYNVRRKFYHIKSPPIPGTLTWFLGLLPEFKRRINESQYVSGGHVLMGFSQEYGWDLFVLPLFTSNVIYCMELDILAKVIADYKTFPKDTQYQETFSSVGGVRIFGNYGLLSDPGTEVWNAKRRAMDPGFHKSFMKSILPGMNTVVNNLLGVLSTRVKEGIIDVSVDMNRSAFEAISICGFNMDSDVIAMHGGLVVETSPLILQGMSLSLRDRNFNYPWKYRQEKKALKDRVPIVREVVKQHLQDRMNSDIPHSSDILSHIIQSNKCSDQLTIDDLVDDYLVFLIAGMETTAITMAITLFYLANNSKILAKVREEIDSVAERGQMLEFEDVNKLVYMQMVIKECMRVKPPVRGIGRCCAKDNVSVNGLNIPKGADFFIPIMALHHDSRHWDKPEVFNPERFSSGSKVKSFSYLPFMAGPRSCIGKNFAMLEAKMIISRVVQEFDIENPYPEVTDVETDGLITARPLDGVKLKLHPRFIS